MSNTKTYICTGCGIGECLDIDKLKAVPKDHSLEESTVHPFLCSPEGIATIQKDVDAGATKVVVAACSRRVFPERFTFGRAVFLDRVNLREGVTWVSEPNTEDTRLLAKDYLAMGCVRVSKGENPEPFIADLDNTVLVVGGGITGLTSALEVSKAGKKVVLVEKEKELGGFMSKMKARFPRGDGFMAPEDTGMKAKIDEVYGDKNITVHTGTVVEKIAGQPGMFDVTIKNGSSDTFKAGTIIQATGFKPYPGEKLGHLGYGSTKNVVTNAEFEEMAATGDIKKPTDGKEPKTVAFIQCAGSRDPEHLSYCSEFCCMATLKHASYLRQQNENIRVFIIYKDMRTPGKYEYFYKSIQDDDGIFLTRGEVASVEAGPGDGVSITVSDTLLGESIKINAEMLVLAAGMESAQANNEEGTLHLDYRQGPELPGLSHGFPDSHYICFPYETRRTGIYSAGPVRHPMDGSASEMDATGAALKAIQCQELSREGKAVHPRVGDTGYPDIRRDSCTQCKRCTEECPYSMYNEDDKSNPEINPLRCRRCGICMGACPQKIISFKDYSIDMVSSMLRAVSMQDEAEEEYKTRVLILGCENDALPALDMIAQDRMTKLNPMVRILPIRCLGSMSMEWLNDALSAGYDGVILMGCAYGDDYQCHNMKGSELAHERMTKLEDTLSRMGLEKERLLFTPVAINDYKKLPGIIEEFVKQIDDDFGHNPFKEFAI